MKTHGGVEVYPHIFLTLALDRGEWSASCPVHFIPRETPPYQVDMKFGGPQSWSGHGGEEKIPSPAGD